MDTNEVFDAYERRFARAMAGIPIRKPWLEEDKKEIISLTKKSLGLRDEWIPEIKITVLRSVRHEKFRIDFIKFESWKNVVGSAHLYVPAGTGSKALPLVIHCCGHAEDGKLYSGYQLLAGRMAEHGIMVLIPDNIGQGERKPMGHGDSVMPFACGMSVQGLIVMETLAWIEWAKKNPLVDGACIAAVGSSGGGTLTMFLAALSKGLCAIASSGYPSTFEFIARKEKKHCHCNLIPGIVGLLEMWELYGVFAPKKLLLFQGAEDSLIPMDIFYSTARKVKSVYEAASSEENFSFRVTPGAHSLDSARRFLETAFIAGAMGLPPPEDIEKDDKILTEADGKCFDAWPEDAMSVDDIAKTMSGINPPENLKLCDVYVPSPMPDKLSQVSPRGDTLQILAQYECFLSGENKFFS